MWPFIYVIRSVFQHSPDYITNTQILTSLKKTELLCIKFSIDFRSFRSGWKVMFFTMQITNVSLQTEFNQLNCVNFKTKCCLANISTSANSKDVNLLSGRYSVQVQMWCVHTVTTATHKSNLKKVMTAIPNQVPKKTWTHSKDDDHWQECMFCTCETKFSYAAFSCT